MIKYALFDYVPKRFLKRVTFEQQDICRKLLGFKQGKNIYSRWAARLISRALAGTDLKNVTIVCIPASTQYAYVRRWKLFSAELCRMTGAINGFDRIQVCGTRSKAHISGVHELSNNFGRCVHIDTDFFYGKKVLVIDDVYTTGKTSSSFINAMQSSGAYVLAAMFLGRTKRFF